MPRVSHRHPELDAYALGTGLVLSVPSDDATRYRRNVTCSLVKATPHTLTVLLPDGSRRTWYRRKIWNVSFTSGTRPSAEAVLAARRRARGAFLRDLIPVVKLAAKHPTQGSAQLRRLHEGLVQEQASIMDGQF